MSASFVRSGEQTELPFTDVDSGAYYYDAVRWAVEQGVASGVTGTAFAPGRGCTRAQLVTFLWRANGSPEPSEKENPFTDVSPDSYYYKAVLWAVEQGITSGVTKTAFAPDRVCTRAQAAVLLWRAEGSPAASGTHDFRTWRKVRTMRTRWPGPWRAV
ncbi:MAG: S-layer homology domain-containing protein [Dysosmobacter welbionis]